MLCQLTPHSQNKPINFLFLKKLTKLWSVIFTTDFNFSKLRKKFSYCSRWTKAIMNYFQVALRAYFIGIQNFSLIYHHVSKLKKYISVIKNIMNFDFFKLPRKKSSGFSRVSEMILNLLQNALKVRQHLYQHSTLYLTTFRHKKLKSLK